MKMFLLLLFLAYNGSITLFTHSHTINGKFVTHSHPFSPKGHQHSSSEVQHISLLTDFNATGESNSFSEILSPLTCTLAYMQMASLYHSAGRQTTQDRAPPVLM